MAESTPNLNPDALKKAQEILDRFCKEILAPNAAELKLHVDHLKDKDITEFGKVAGQLIKRSMASLHQMLEMPVGGTFASICPGLGDNISFETVASFNEVLPLDFPYLTALFRHPELKYYLILFLERKLIPGAHDLLNPRVVPIVDPASGIGGYFSDVNEFADFIKKHKENQ